MGSNILNNPNSKLKACILAHDAGGAELISSWVRNSTEHYDFAYSIHGPALQVFKRKLGSFTNLRMEEAVEGAEKVFVGTSWGSDIEIEALKISRKLAYSHSVAFLDHWVNYKERFSRDGMVILSDEIWVSDSYAFEIASNLFRGTPISLIRNYYLEEITSIIRITAAESWQKKGNQINILFLGENVSANCERTFGDANYYGYTEQESFSYFLERINKFGNMQNIVLRIRPHPSETAEKYTSLIPVSLKGKLNYFISKNSLEVDLANSDLVVGMSSFALFIAVNSHIKTLCVIPDSSIKCVIPDARIERL